MLFCFLRNLIFGVLRPESERNFKETLRFLLISTKFSHILFFKEYFHTNNFGQFRMSQNCFR